MAQYVYTMNRVGKIVPPKRQILKDISLSFFPGAKIGVLGLNGSGKTTLLKIMAGVDNEIEGEAVPMPGLKIGYLPQEPQLDPDADRARGGRSRASAACSRPRRARRGLRRLRRARRRLRQARRRAGRARSDHRRGRQREHRPPARDRRRRAAPAAVGRRRSASCRAARSAASRCAACCCRKPDMLLLDEPTNHLDAESVEWLEHLPQALPGHRGGDHPRPLLPRQRGRVDSRTRPRPRHPVEGQLLQLAGPEGAAPGAGAEDRRRAHEGDEEGAGVGAPERQGPPGQEQGAAGALRGAERRRIPEAQRDQRDLHPGGRAPGQRGDRVQERHQELRRPRADRQPEVQGAGRRHRRHHRPQRRRQVDAVPHDPGQGKARHRRGRGRPDRASWPSSTRAARAWPTTRRCGRTSPAASTTSSSASS